MIYIVKTLVNNPYTLLNARLLDIRARIYIC